MPIYEYRCDKCGHELEAIQKMSADPLTECPACGEAALRKLVSAAGFHLKGSGWYVTDFRDKKAGGEGGKGGSANAGKGGKGSTGGGSEKSGSDKGTTAAAGASAGTQGSSGKGS